MMKLRSALLAATLLAAPVAAHAQPVDGLYVGAGVGYNYLQNLKLGQFSYTDPANGQAVTGSNLGKLSGDGGFIGSAAVGYGLGNGLRIELQGDYRADHQKLRHSDFDGGTSDTQSYGGYINALFDFDIGMDFFYPYIGAGAGYRWTDLHNFQAYPPGAGGTGLGATGDNQAEGGFSAQGMVGGSFPFPGLPGLSVTAEYRFTGVFEKVKFHGTQTFSTPPTGYTTKAQEQYNHSFLVGLRYAFNVPAPPPPAPVEAAPPAPAPARTYLVFFDWDKYNLNERARQIIAEAAANIPKVQVTRIEVNGYTDTSGTPAYNLGLSRRRANAVAAELVRLGVPRSEIVAKGFGDTNLLVQTGPGVREPQNRRVEIILK